MKWLMPWTTLLRILTIVFLGPWPTHATLDAPKSAWPPGTVANGSTTHPAVGDINFYSSYAIDGDTDTKWNDDTQNVLPDILTIETPSPVILDGIILLSSMDGWVLNYTVQTPNGSGWTVQATVTKAESALRYVPFISPVQTTQLRIVVTDVQDGGFTRIQEVYPIFIAATSNTSESNPTSTDTGAAKTSAVSGSSSLPAPSKSPKNSNTGAIAGGVLGAVVLMLSVALAALLFSRKRRPYPPQSVPKRSILPAELSSHPRTVPFVKPELESR